MDGATTNGTPLPVAVVGCDFRIISSRWRSLLILEEEEAKRVTADLRRSSAADGFVDITTCNRNEWVVSSSQPAWAAELVRSWMLGIPSRTTRATHGDILGSRHDRSEALEHEAAHATDPTNRHGKSRRRHKALFDVTSTPARAEDQQTYDPDNPGDQ